MTALSRLATLGLAPEATPGTYLAPTVGIPFLKADFEDVYSEIKDESYRNNDSILQGMYQGPVVATWDIDVLAYPDLIGHVLRGIIGPDTIVAGVSTTLSSASSIGATTISTAASIAAQSYIAIDTGANLEYAKVTAVSGTGPYTLTVTGTGSTNALTIAHLSGATVASQTTHTFKQANPPVKKTYSLTVYDTQQTLGYAYATFSDVAIKIDPKAAVSFNCKLKAMPGASQAAFTPAYSGYQPALGWQWTQTNAGASSTRGLTYDMTVKRVVDDIHSSDGIQAPREIFQGPISADGTYKVIFETQNDLNLYLQYSQQPTTATLTQPLAAGNEILTLTMSKSGYFKGKRALGQTYVQADFSLSGIANTTDSGVVSATLANFQSTAY